MYDVWQMSKIGNDESVPCGSFSVSRGERVVLLCHIYKLVCNVGMGVVFCGFLYFMNICYGSLMRRSRLKSIKRWPPSVLFVWPHRLNVDFVKYGSILRPAIPCLNLCT
jgi:hypothetical protein